MGFKLQEYLSRIFGKTSRKRNHSPIVENSTDLLREALRIRSSHMIKGYNNALSSISMGISRLPEIEDQDEVERKIDKTRRSFLRISEGYSQFNPSDYQDRPELVALLADMIFIKSHLKDFDLIVERSRKDEAPFDKWFKELEYLEGAYTSMNRYLASVVGTDEDRRRFRVGC